MSGARCLHALARAFPQLDVRDEREVSQHGSTIERIACWGATTPRAQVRLIVIAILGSWMFLRAVIGVELNMFKKVKKNVTEQQEGSVGSVRDFETGL